jgi:hypothetical protein
MNFNVVSEVLFSEAGVDCDIILLPYSNIRQVFILYEELSYARQPEDLGGNIYRFDSSKDLSYVFATFLGLIEVNSF